MPKKLKLNSSMKTSIRPSRNNTKKSDVVFIIGDWNAKLGSQDIPRVTGNSSLGVQNEAGQRQIEFCQENALVIANTHFQQHKRWLYIWISPDAAAKSLQSCPTLWDPKDGSPPGSSVCGILQARIVEWVAISFSRGSSQPRNQTQVSATAGRFLTDWAVRKAILCPTCLLSFCVIQ